GLGATAAKTACDALGHFEVELDHFLEQLLLLFLAGTGSPTFHEFSGGCFPCGPIGRGGTTDGSPLHQVGDHWYDLATVVTAWHVAGPRSCLHREQYPPSARSCMRKARIPSRDARLGVAEGDQPFLAIAAIRIRCHGSRSTASGTSASGSSGNQ